MKRIEVGIFDLDGVITDTSQLHFKAWKQMFDGFLQHYALQQQQTYIPFTSEDYDQYVNGKVRLDGIQTFLDSRQIVLPPGAAKAPEANTQYYLGEKKQQIYLELIHHQAIPLFSSTIKFIHQLHAHQIKTAVVSSSTNCELLLNKAGIEHLFTTRVDGNTANQLDLAGKPHPALFLEATQRLHLRPSQAFIVEDALSGVAAGKAGQFAFVVGIDRSGQMADAFYDQGANLVVQDLSELDITNFLNKLECVTHGSR